MARPEVPVKYALSPEWKDQNAYIIGGGASLSGFPFPSLEGKNVIGVNDAFRLGSRVCPNVLFGDESWWQRTKWDLEKYVKSGGRVFSVCPSHERLSLPWLHFLYRIPIGLSENPSSLGWNWNTGAAAVNMAYLMGAKRIFLLGFDMAPVAGNTHWHRYRQRKTPKENFNRFAIGFDHLSRGLAKHPEVQVFNVTDGSSALKPFARITRQEMEDL